MRILFAEDSHNVRRVVTESLRRAGHEIHEATTGPQAWALWERQPFPCLIADAALSGLDGLALTRRIRSAGKPDYTYIILLNTDKPGVPDGPDDYYLAKPLNPEELVVRVRLAERILNLEQRLKEALARPGEQSLHDQLTGLYTKKLFEERLAEEFERAQRYQRALTLVLMDVDHFKAYADAHGHAQGDTLLRELSSVLSSSVRRADFVARFGGEEFAILLPETVKSSAMPLAENLRETVGAYPFALRESQPSGAVTISLGVANFPDDATDTESLLKAADAALYRAKRKGRNRIMAAASLPDLE
jgi:diguanylate cyclase (GGDEF)-like protein